MRTRITLITVAFGASLFASTVDAALESRLTGLAYYDTLLDITWAADARIVENDTWANQTAWASTLNLGGVTGWRLPSADADSDGTVVDCSGGGVIGCADNEMGFRFWEEGIEAIVAPSPFSGVSGMYWTETNPPLSNPWYFDFVDGHDYTNAYPHSFKFAWAVHDGDVGLVPIPAAVWLFVSALGMLGWTRRRAA